MKQFFTLMIIMTSSFAASSQGLVISQVYGAGGNAGATYQADFVELFNQTTSPISLSGYSVQYASATGTSWSKSDLPSVTLQSGQYFLLQMSTAGANGIALPTPDATATPQIAMSATAGKVALVNSTTALSGTQCPPPFVASIVDYVGYGSTANCFEGSGPTPNAASSAASLVRASNGCTDNNDNATDFSSAIALARNTGSALNSCGSPVPALSAGPNITNLTTNTGVASAAVSFTLTGFNLTGFPGNINVLASAGLEVSLSSLGGFAGSINVPYTSASLSATLVYVRIASTAPQGAINGTITNSGGGAASNAVVTVTGGVFQNYYNTKAILGLQNTGSWSSTIAGSGASPANFTDAYQLFNIINQAGAIYTGVWNVTGAGNSSRVIVGNGTDPLLFTVLPGIDSVTSATRIDVLNNGVLALQNNRRPFLNSLATGSTVAFAQTGLSTADTIRPPAISYYNLVLSDGIKILSPGTTTVRGNLVINSVQNFNGATSNPFSTIKLSGNFDFLNAGSFEPSPAGDNGRITLEISNPIGTPTITGNGTDMLLFRLRTDSSTTPFPQVQLTGSTNLVLGNPSGGGLQLNIPAASAPVAVFNIGSGSRLSLVAGAASTTSARGLIETNGGNISVLKSTGTTNGGTLRFSPTSLVNNLTIAFDAAFARDSIFIADDVPVTGSLTLTKGKIVVASGKTLSLQSGATVSGGSAASFVDGRLARTGSTAFTFHSGKGNKYAPVNTANLSGANTYTVQYFNNGYGTYAINPSTLSGFPNYEVSRLEHWIINQASAGTVDLTFNYTDAASQINVPAAIRMAHFGAVDWNDLAGTPGGGNTTTSGSVTVTGVSSFSPFTFGATASGVIPVKLSSFTVQKSGNKVLLNWTSSQETNSSHYIVQQSTDGRNWKDITRVNAAGFSSRTLTYNATDYTPSKGMNFYRLKQYDLDNRFDYSATRTALFTADFEVLITPNPVTDFIQLYISKTSNKAALISITDMQGKTMLQLTSAESTIQIPVSRFAKGMYTIKIQEEGAVISKQLLIQ
jgi:hypothetical protein